MPRILLVDDEHLLLMLLADLLEDEGYHIDTAANGDAALARARACQPALIITDFMMPIMTGLDLARSIRADGDLREIPIILVSGAQAAIGRGHPDLFQSVIDKPYQNETLLEEVRRLLA
ncbi:response regulator [Sphingobium baderi]|uniref:response regulator n=1 Tax=Sphingobium baderi TaxID=1332080 RepID=UPI002B401A38|nr:response regulator [Sphingobium baderi]